MCLWCGCLKRVIIAIGQKCDIVKKQLTKNNKLKVNNNTRRWRELLLFFPSFFFVLVSFLVS